MHQDERETQRPSAAEEEAALSVMLGLANRCSQTTKHDDSAALATLLGLSAEYPEDIVAQAVMVYEVYPRVLAIKGSM